MRTTRFQVILAGCIFLGIGVSITNAAAPAAPQGVITAKEFLNIGGGTTIPDLTNNAKFPNNPDTVNYPILFEWPANSDGSQPPGNVKDNYGIQIIGYFYPPTTTTYTFYLAADDNAVLYLSTDSNPANKKLIAVETAWSPVRGWDSTAGGSDVTAKNSSTYAGSQWPGGGAAINLTAGQAYYIEALEKEGIGGDNVAVSIDLVDPIPGALLSSFDKTTGPVSIKTQPQNQAVGENLSATFSVEADGTPPYTYQWQKMPSGGAFADILDATNRVYTIAAAPLSDNNAQFRCVVSGAAGTPATSNPATLSVSNDNTPPTIVRVTGSASFTTATVVFSEPVTAASAGTLANYSFAGLTISAATIVNPTTVQLTTGTQTEGASYVLTVNNIRDISVVGNTIAANSQVTLRAWVFSRGFAAWERWQDRGGETTPIDTFVANLIDPAFRPPDVTGVSTYLGSPRGVADNYGLRASAYFIPPTSGNYVFFMACDDNGYLFLSTDSNPANKKKIAAQPQWSDQNQWLDPDLDRTQGLAENSSDQYSASEWVPANTITLTAGQKYYIELDFQEGGGGDGSEAYYKLASAADPVNGTAPNTRGAVIGTYADPSTASLTITQQPQNANIPENTSATFTVAATGSVATLFYQWQKAPAAGTFTDIAGANNASYTTPALPLSEGGSRYRVAISVPGLTSNSTEAVVTVFSDSVPPTLVSALRNFSTDTQVIVVFSELMQSASANVAGNYTINNGITVSTAALQADGKTVVLTTSSIAKGTSNTLTVNGVRDLAGNSIAASSQIAIGFQRGAILVTADPGPLTFPGDIAVQQHLEARGYDVLLARGSDLPDDGSTANGRDIIVQSSSLASGTMVAAAGGAKFLNITIPLVEWEASNEDDYNFQSANGTTTAADQTDINIVDATHPIAAGLSAGLHTVVTSPQVFSQAGPAPLAPVNAHIIATRATTSDAVIYCYNTGDTGLNGFVMPARRAFFFFQDNTAAAANADGWKLFDATVDWLQNIAVAVQPRFNAPTISGGNITISWTGTGTLEQTDSLSPPNWQSAPSQANPQTPSATTGTRFYRIRQ